MDGRQKDVNWNIVPNQSTGKFTFEQVNASILSSRGLEQHVRRAHA